MRGVSFFDLITGGNLGHSMEGVVKFILKVPARIYSSFNKLTILPWKSNLKFLDSNVLN